VEAVYSSSYSVDLEPVDNDIEGGSMDSLANEFRHHMTLGGPITRGPITRWPNSREPKERRPNTRRLSRAKHRDLAWRAQGAQGGTGCCTE